MTNTPLPPNNPNYFSVILTSVVVSALISGVFLLLNDWLRRKSEEKKFKLEIALKLAQLREKQFMEWIKDDPHNKTLPSIVELFRVHLEAVEKYWKKGEI